MKENEQSIRIISYPVLNDFRKVRISFTANEVDQYVRSLWAYELWVKAGKPVPVANVKEIPKDIAARADGYKLVLKDGRTLRPWYCIAAFYGPELEKLVCTNMRAVILEDSGRAGFMLTVMKAIDSLTPAIRRVQDREEGLAPWPVGCEDDVRDLLYVTLRAVISDVRTEEPVPSRAGTYKMVDIFSSLAGVLVEVKWVGKPRQWKRILREINDDIQSYVKHPACKTLIFVVVDNVKDIPDPAQFERDLTGKQTIDGKEIEILTFVRET